MVTRISNQRIPPNMLAISLKCYLISHIKCHVIGKCQLQNKIALCKMGFSTQVPLVPVNVFIVYWYLSSGKPIFT